MNITWGNIAEAYQEISFSYRWHMILSYPYDCFDFPWCLTGNDAIHTLTKKNDQVLWVQLQSLDCDQFYAKYTTFHVGNAASKYKLTVSGPSGTAGMYVFYLLS